MAESESPLFFYKNLQKKPETLHLGQGESCLAVAKASATAFPVPPWQGRGCVASRRRD